MVYFSTERHFASNKKVRVKVWGMKLTFSHSNGKMFLDGGVALSSNLFSLLELISHNIKTIRGFNVEVNRCQHGHSGRSAMHCVY